MNENTYHSQPQGQNYQPQPQQGQNNMQRAQQSQQGYTQQFPTYAPPVTARTAVSDPKAAPAVTSENKKKSKLVPILLIVLAVFTVANTALLAYTLMNNSEVASAKNQLKEDKLYNNYSEGIAEKCLEVDDFEIIESYDFSSDFEFTLENKSSRDLADVYVYYSGYDSRGDFAGSSYTYLPYLDANSEIIISDYLPGTDIEKIEITRFFAVYATDLYN